MRTLPAGTVTPLLGSLGLHAGAALLIIVAVRRPLSQVSAAREADAWAGAALEVDAVATSDGVPRLPNADSPLSASPAAAGDALPAPARLAAERARVLTKSEPDAPPLPHDHRPPRHLAGVAPAARDSVASHDSQARSKAGTQAATGAFGSSDLPPGVRSLPNAFTRAIPPATGADPIWQRLPTGQQRPFTIALRVDAEGHIRDSRWLEDRPGNTLPEQFVHLRERVVALLGAGQFALQDGLSAGYDVFRVTISLSERAVQDEREPAELVERGFDPPQGARPGRAYFTLASGRHFEARVEVLKAERAGQTRH